MGLLLEFFAGDAKAIGAAFERDEWDSLRRGPPAIAFADFSLHIGVEHLDTLSAVIAEHTRQEPVMFIDSWTTDLVDGDGSGAHVIDPAWVAMVAALDPADARPVSAAWLRRVGEEQGEALEPTDDAATAVSNLVALCRKAIAAKADVVHIWSL